MEIVYYGSDLPEKITKSIFLGGCSTRNLKEVPSWRPDALQILEDAGFDGVVFVPEFKDPENKLLSYSEIIEWEDEHLNIADAILFHIPRDLSLDSNGDPKNLGLTTNIEFGRWDDSGKIFLSIPEDAEKVSYVKYYADKFKVKISDNLTDAFSNIFDYLENGATRTAGERCIPLYIWNLSSFQNWYKSQTKSGNKLTYAKVLWSYRSEYKDPVFFWVLQTSIYVKEEDRIVENEFVISRTDISSVLLWKKNLPIGDSEIVLLKEFRPSLVTKDSFMRGMPSGSSPSEEDSMTKAAIQEIQEETSFYLDPTRLKKHMARQMMPTMAANKSYFFSAKISDEELNWFKSQKNVVHGNHEFGEKTYIEVYKMKDILANKIELDWSTLGQILFVYCNEWGNPEL